MRGLFVIVILFICISCSKEESYLHKDAMSLGVKLLAPTPNYTKYEDDLIHPCVRYIEGGFGGHEWWMIGTPYKNNDESKENPILYYGDSEKDGTPPLSWTAVSVIVETPIKGYNSDPSLYYDGKKLWIFWRENHTPDCYKNKYERATFGCYSLDGKNFSDKKFFAGELSLTEDSEVCPIVLNCNGELRLFGTHYIFKPKRKPKGLSIWTIENNNLEGDNSFKKVYDVSVKGPKALKFWHFDLFYYKNVYYSVATSENAKAVFLGRSTDGLNFEFWSTPLLTNKYTGRTYFYKPSALVKDGIFYLWNPVAEEDTSSKTSRIWMSKISFSELISTLEKYEN